MQPDQRASVKYLTVGSNLNKRAITVNVFPFGMVAICVMCRSEVFPFSSSTANRKIAKFRIISCRHDKAQVIYNIVIDIR